MAITDWFHTPASLVYFTAELPGPPPVGDTGIPTPSDTPHLFIEWQC